MPKPTFPASLWESPPGHPGGLILYGSMTEGTRIPILPSRRGCMKKLILINGPMGVGKSTVCRRLLSRMQPCALLDGDWCWTMSPFVVSEENKKMVMGNIIHVLRSFLSNTSFESIIFCWVLHREDTFNELLNALKDLPFDLHAFSLISSPEELQRRLQHDKMTGRRNTDVTEESLARLPFYASLPTCKIDTTNQTPDQIAERILFLTETREPQSVLRDGRQQES